MIYGVYKDITRHRLASYSIESTRYCNYSKDKFNNKISFIKPVFYDSSWQSNEYYGKELTEKQLKSKQWYNCMLQIQNTYNNMSKLDCPPDELRMILPHSTAAEVTMTSNIREWKHILSLRCSKMTHPSVQQIMIPILKHFQFTMPEIFNNVDYNKDFPKDKYAKFKLKNNSEVF